MNFLSNQSDILAAYNEKLAAAYLFYEADILAATENLNATLMASNQEYDDKVALAFAKNEKMIADIESDRAVETANLKEKKSKKNKAA